MTLSTDRQQSLTEDQRRIALEAFIREFTVVIYTETELLCGRYGDQWKAWLRSWELATQEALKAAMQACEKVEEEEEKYNRHRWPELQNNSESGARSCYFAIEALANDTQSKEKP